MTVYVDDMNMAAVVTGPGAPKGSRRWSHMMADTLPELEAMARTVGLNPAWLQDRRSGVHYDVTARVRMLAIKAGAVPIECGSDKWREVHRAAMAQYPAGEHRG